MKNLMEVFSDKLKLMGNLKGIVIDNNSSYQKLRVNYSNSVKLYSATISILEKIIKCVTLAESNIKQVLKTIKANQQKQKK